MSERFDDEVSALVARLDDCGCAEGKDCGANCQCDELVSSLYELIDHEMPVADEHRLLHHVEGCASCQKSVKVEYLMRSVVKRGCAEDAPDSLREKIASAVRSTDV